MPSPGSASRSTGSARARSRKSARIAVLNDVRVAVADWPQMRRARSRSHGTGAAPGVPDRRERSERVARVDGRQPLHVPRLSPVPLGAAARRPLEPLPKPVSVSCDDGAAASGADGTHRRAARAGASAELLDVTKANSVSTVHRATYLDYIGVKTFDPAGRVTGEHRFLGLFTSSPTAATRARSRCCEQKIDASWRTSASPESHDAKAVVNVIETYPRDELFQTPVADLMRIVRGIVNLYERRRVRVFVRRDRTALLFLPGLRAARPLQHAGARAHRAIVREALAGRARIAGADLGFHAGAPAHAGAHRPPSARSRPTRADRALIAETLPPGTTACAGADRKLRAERARSSRTATPARFRRPIAPTSRTRIALEDIEDLEALRALRRSRCSCTRAPRPARVHLRLVPPATRSRSPTSCPCSRISGCGC